MMLVTNNSITNTIIYLLIIFSCFPYIEFLPLGTDSQPNALLVSLLIFPFCAKWRMPKNLVLLLLLFLFSVLLLLFSQITFGSIRSLVNYFSLFLISYATFYALRRIKGMPYSLFKSIVYIWFFVGTVQLFIYPDFMSFLIPRGNSSLTIESGRGIVCLAPEPTFYGIICALFAMLAYLNFNEHPHVKRLYFLLVVQLFLYSRSSMVILMLVLALAISYLHKIFSNKRYMMKSLLVSLIVLIASSLLLPFLANMLVDYRIGVLLKILIDEPETFLFADASVNERFIHVFFPIYGCISHWGIPHGYEQFASFMEECFKDSDFQFLFTNHVLEGQITRIMSGWGSLFFELGGVGLILAYVIYNLFSSLYNGFVKIFMLTLFTLLLLNAVPFSNPLIPFLIGNMIYLNYEKKTNTLSD